MKDEKGNGHATHVRVELRYCERCGALGIQAQGAGAHPCLRCASLLAWLGAEAQR